MLKEPSPPKIGMFVDLKDDKGNWSYYGVVVYINNDDVATCTVCGLPGTPNVLKVLPRTMAIAVDCPIWLVNWLTSSVPVSSTENVGYFFWSLYQWNKWLRPHQSCYRLGSLDVVKEIQKLREEIEEKPVYDPSLPRGGFF